MALLHQGQNSQADTRIKRLQTAADLGARQRPKKGCSKAAGCKTSNLIRGESNCRFSNI